MLSSTLGQTEIELFPPGYFEIQQNIKEYLQNFLIKF